MKILLFLLIFLTIYASSYPTFTSSELQNIEKYSGFIAKNRVIDYTNTIQSYKKYSKNEQLTKVNYYLNKIIPKKNRSFIDRQDHWTTPKEFLTSGFADCEDYAIIKYFTLLKLGFEEEKLFMTVAYDKYSKQHHMVLSYFKNEGTPPLILDNLSFRVLNLQKRKDLEVNMFVNSSGVYAFDENEKLIKVASGAKKFNELLQRINKES